jgi:hypothetical protein
LKKFSLPSGWKGISNYKKTKTGLSCTIVAKIKNGVDEWIMGDKITFYIDSKE